jgi:tetratricopeptide (TPR) repeat protein
MSAITEMIIFIGLALGAWWLSGYDPRVTGENAINDFVRRALRLLVTAVLLAILFGIQPAGLVGGYGYVPILMVAPIAVALIWCGCIAECWSHLFRHLMYSDGKGEFDPHADTREMDRVATLLKKGRHQEALRLSQKLMESGTANVLVLETLLARAGIPWTSLGDRNPLVDACRLRAEGKFLEAEKILNSALAEDPSNAQALLLLIRLYAESLEDPAKAADTLRLMEKRRGIPAWQIEYARRSLPEWSQKKTAPPPVFLPETIDQLLAEGYSGTAIEMIEQKLQEQPGDFNLWLKLAEARGLHCSDIPSAEKIVRKMEKSSAFTPEQIQTARAKLAEWRQPRPQKK